jgi:hypothetical protein
MKYIIINIKVAYPDEWEIETEDEVAKAEEFLAGLETALEDTVGYSPFIFLSVKSKFEDVRHEKIDK